MGRSRYRLEEDSASCGGPEVVLMLFRREHSLLNSACTVAAGKGLGVTVQWLENNIMRLKRSYQMKGFDCGNLEITLSQN
jgi:hypothetical protein